MSLVAVCPRFSALTDALDSYSNFLTRMQAASVQRQLSSVAFGTLPFSGYSLVRDHDSLRCPPLRHVERLVKMHYLPNRFPMLQASPPRSTKRCST